MEDGGWRMENGEWRMEQWKLSNEHLVLSNGVGTCQSEAAACPGKEDEEEQGTVHHARCTMNDEP